MERILTWKIVSKVMLLRALYLRLMKGGLKQSM